MGRRTVRLHIDGNDSWLDIRRSSPTPQGGPDDDWITGVVAVILFVIFVVWLLS